MNNLSPELLEIIKNLYIGFWLSVCFLMVLMLIYWGVDVYTDRKDSGREGI